MAQGERRKLQGTLGRLYIVAEEDLLDMSESPTGDPASMESTDDSYYRAVSVDRTI